LIGDYNHIITKILVLLSSKIPFDHLDQISQILYQLYGRYAHLWPALYNFRAWILQTFKLSYEPHIIEKINVSTGCLSDMERALNK